MLFESFTVTVWTVEVQNWCACEGANYPVDFDFPTFEEAQDFYQKFWTTELSSHPDHLGWCEERHTLSLGVKGSGGDLQSFVCSADSVDPVVLTHKDWVVPEFCSCRDCLQAQALEEELAASQEVDLSDHLEDLLPAGFTFAP